MALPRIEPIIPIRRREPFDDPGWLFDVKYDGFRAVCYVEQGRARLGSRNGNDLRRFDALGTQIAEALEVSEATPRPDHGLPRTAGAGVTSLCPSVIPCVYMQVLIFCHHCDLVHIDEQRRRLDLLCLARISCCQFWIKTGYQVEARRSRYALRLSR